MKSRRRNASNDRRSENSEPIPTDLIIEILSRLPAKSIARCRCVSKHWASMLRRPDFTELFLTRSSTRPQILFVCAKDDELLFFSAPQVHNPNENSSLVALNHHMKFHFFDYSEISSVSGLVCFTHDMGDKHQPVLCNPSTGQFLTKLPFPTLNTRYMYSFFGYDPIEKQFKVLFTMVESGAVCDKRQVLTFGTNRPSWRTLKSHIPHNPFSNGICIDGVVYYVAAIDEINLIGCFDVRFETFSFIEKAEDMFFRFQSVLVNYMGRLGVLLSDAFARVTRETECFEMWVLEDPEKHVWSKHVYELPPMWKNLVGDAEYHLDGVTGTNEILLSPESLSDPFYVFYYNIESKTVRRVQIQGMEALGDCFVYTCVNHVEDVTLMDMFSTYNLRSRKRFIQVYGNSLYL